MNAKQILSILLIISIATTLSIFFIQAQSPFSKPTEPKTFLTASGRYRFEWSLYDNGTIGLKDAFYITDGNFWLHLPLDAIPTTAHIFLFHLEKR